MATSSVKRVLKQPSDEQPTSKQISVTLRLDVQRLRILPVDPVADPA